MIVRCADRVSLGDRLAFLEGLRCGEAIIQDVGPETRGSVHREGTVGRAVGTVDAPGLRAVRVHIGHAQRTDHRGRARDERAWVGLARFRHATRRGGEVVGDDRDVIGTVDGDRDRLVSDSAEVVRDADREVLSDRLAGLEGLGGGLGVVQGVGPHAGDRVDREATVGRRRRAHDRPSAGRRGVHVRRGQGARGDRRTGHARAHFRHGADLSGVEVGDDWRIVRAVDGDGDRLVDRGRLVVRRADRVSLGHRLAFLEALGRRKGVIQDVGPETRGSVHREGTVGRRRRTDNRPGLRRVRVHIGHRESANHGGGARDERTGVGLAGFRHATRRGGEVVSNDREVVRAVDRDDDGLVGDGAEVIRHANREALGDRLAGLEGLGSGLGVVQGVGPHAGDRVDHEATVGRRRRTDDRPSAGRRGVHVGGSQGTLHRSGTEGTRADFRHCTGLRGVGTGDHWRVIRTSNRDGDELFNEGTLIIRGANRVDLGDGLAFLQALRRREAVIQNVGPLARRSVDREGAVDRQRRALNRPGLRRVAVHIGHRERADHRGSTRDDGTGIRLARFRHRAEFSGGVIGDDREVVRTVDGDGDRLVGDGTEVVRHANREGFGDRLAGLEGLRGRKVVVQEVRPNTRDEVDSEVTVGRRRRTHHRPGAGRCGVHVRGSQGALHRGRTRDTRADFRHRAGLRLGAVGDDRCVVRTVDRDRDRLVHRGTLVVRRPDRVDLRDRLAFLERLRRREAVV